MENKEKLSKTDKSAKSLKKDLLKKVELPSDFDVNKTYSVEGLSGAKHLIKGKIYEVSGEIAKELIKKGVAKIV